MDNKIRKIVESKLPFLNYAERLLVIEQAEFLLSELYVHLRQKEASRAILPLQKLRLLAADIKNERNLNKNSDGEEISAADSEELDNETDLQLKASNFDFHYSMFDIFIDLKDFHTKYDVRIKGSIYARLPFTVKRYFDPVCNKCRNNSRFRYFVDWIDNKTIDNLELGSVSLPNFKVGVEITHWNGVEIDNAISILAKSYYGSNEQGLFEEGLKYLTERPLDIGKAPIEEWINITYISKQEGNPWKDSEVFNASFPWRLDRVCEEGQGEEGNQVEGTIPKVYEETRIGDMTLASKDACNCAPTDSAIVFKFLENPRYRHIDAALLALEDEYFAYVKIRGFPENAAEHFVSLVDSFEGFLCNDQEIKGLIIDLKDCDGGYIEEAEKILQALANIQLDPTDFQLRSTDTNLAIASIYDLKYCKWIDSLKRSVRTGEEFSSGRWLTEKKILEEFREYVIENDPYGRFFQLEKGSRARVAMSLIINATSYSAADVFAAGFQDYNLGDLLGTNNATGGAGANVVSFGKLAKILKTKINEFEELPEGVSIYFAHMRAIRRGVSSGLPLEDMGVSLRDEDVLPLQKGDIFYANGERAEVPFVLLGEAIQRIKEIAGRGRPKPIDHCGEVI